MAEFLLELLSEEIPARMQERAGADLKHLITKGMRAAGLAFSDARGFTTPRRLTLVVDGIPECSEDQTIEKRGPRVGAPEPAIRGFLKAAGLSSLDQAEKRDTGKGEFWFAVQRVAGSDARNLLAGIVTDALDEMPWPKSMRWGANERTWVRPLQGIVAQLDGKDVDTGYYAYRSAAAVQQGLYLLRSTNATRGHRFLSHGPIPVAGFQDYVEKLRAGYVVLDPAEREQIVRERALELCHLADIVFVNDPGLMSEVVGLVEWPIPLLGEIDSQFMELPPEVLIVSMRSHQRYFATTKKDGSLANRFVVVANNVAKDGGKTIVGGNERVLRARLADAKFFWDLDRKTRLEERLPALKDIVFHASLGTQAERVQRIAVLATAVADFVPGADKAQVMMAAELCKADLVSGMVGEFPELQGVMGRYYALHEKLPAAVAEAIGDHYAPAGPNDRCPSAPVSVAVALADKLDALTSFWSIGEKPTGSRDPYALRRAALGVIRLVVENRLRVGLKNIFFRALVFSLVHANIAEQQRIKSSPEHDVYKEPYSASAALMKLAADATQLGKIARREMGPRERDVAIVNELMDFFAERLKVQMRDKGVRHDVIDAVFALGSEDDLVRLLARVEALQSFLGTDAGKNLLTGYGRAANIVRAEERKDKTLAARIATVPDVALLELAEEKAVASALAEVERTVKPALKQENFSGAMQALAGLRAPIDAFFDKVTVNVQDKPDLRLNRLKLLNQIRATMDAVADFSKIEG